MTPATTTTDTFDPWALIDRSAPSRGALVSRARKRLAGITPVPLVSAAYRPQWRVAGDKKLSDAYAEYLVTFDAGTNAYDCKCYHSDHGGQRARTMCSHVLAVVLYRQSNPVHPVEGLPLDTVTRTVDTGTPTASSPPELAWQGSGCGQRSNVPPPLAHDSDILPTDPRWGAPLLPTKFVALRQHQVDAVEQIEDAFTRCSLVFADAPLGSGKSLIAELARRRVARRALYVCSSIPLQRQFTDDFTYARELKGRGNYEPYYSDTGATCADCTAAPPATTDCFFCPDINTCPYRVAKARAHDAELTVLNTSYWLHATNYVGEFADRDLVIIDEADMLEAELMSFVEFKVSEWQLDKLGVTAPIKGAHKSTIAAWFTADLGPAIVSALRSLPDPGGDVRKIRDKQGLQRLAAAVTRIAGELDQGDESNWVRDNDAGPLVLKPVKVAAQGPAHIWAHGKKFLLMSGTLVSPESIAESLGYTGDFETVKVPHTFPIANRQVIVAPVANVTFKEKDTAYPALANALCNIAARHPDERILVHTVSYALTRYLHEALDKAGFAKRALSYTQAKDRDRMLDRMRRLPGAILLAPSMDRGIDLPGDDCRVQVICKVPYASLGDKQVSARLHSEGGQTWFSANTVRSLVQMTGRAVRSADDHAIAYLIDSQFQSNVVKKSKHLLPAWFVEALVYEFPVREITRPYTTSA